MFDIGFWEILIMGIVALVVLGPERLPAAARTLGLYVGKAQRFLSGVKSDFNQELQNGDLQSLIGDQKRQIDELRSLVNETKTEFQQAANHVSKPMDSALQAVQNSVDDINSSVNDSQSKKLESSDKNGEINKHHE